MENIKDYDRELIYDAKNLMLEQVYSKCEEDDFFIKFRKDWWKGPFRIDINRRLVTINE